MNGGKGMEEILRAYHVKAEKTEKITHNLWYVKTKDQEYALKKGNFASITIDDWQMVFQIARNKSFSFILPVIATHNGQLFIKSNENIYYLMPWLQHKQYDFKKIYKALGKLHRDTKVNSLYQQKELQATLKNYRRTIKGLFDELLQYIYTYERQIYMSPLELQVCMHYRHIEKAIQTLSEKIDRFLMDAQDSNHWGLGLCHGQLSMSHILVSDQVYFINWEKAHYGHAVTDLLALFQDAKKFNFPKQSMKENFSTYLKENPLSLQEHLLLCIYLLNITPYMKVLRYYHEKSSSDRMVIVEQVKTLEQHYRKIVFGLEWAKYISENIEPTFKDSSFTKASLNKKQ